MKDSERTLGELIAHAAKCGGNAAVAAGKGFDATMQQQIDYLKATAEEIDRRFDLSAPATATPPPVNVALLLALRDALPHVSGETRSAWAVQADELAPRIEDLLRDGQSAAALEAWDVVVGRANARLRMLANCLRPGVSIEECREISAAIDAICDAVIKVSGRKPG